jgi:hypothetical protein
MASNGTQAAVSQTPSDGGEGPLVFFDPIAICAATSGPKSLLNQALLVHESLHGLYAVDDLALENLFGESSDPGITYHLDEQMFGGDLLYLYDTPASPEPLTCPSN